MQRICLLLFLFFSWITLFGQTTNSGKPRSVELSLALPEKLVRYDHIQSEIELVNQVNLQRVTRTKEYRFGKEIELDLDVLANGSGLILPNGNPLIRLRLQSVTAVSLSLIFKKFELQSGDQMYLFDVQTNKAIGAYTALNNSPEQVLGTEILYSDDIVVEIEINRAVALKRQLVIGQLIHGFRRLDELAKDLNSSGDCMYDVNCSVGANWKDPINATVMIINGGTFCSGTMINNTTGQTLPYLLTANHCGTSNVGAWVFRFGYESPANKADCGTVAPSGDGPTNKVINGGALKATSSISDFTLIRLNSTPPTAWNVYYAGWDRTGNAPLSGVGIHHPSGDVKKISIEKEALVSSNYGTLTPNSHWKVTNWDLGVTEGGSSGSGFFDQNKRLVGQLHGGASICGGQSGTQEDEYGKFSVSWDGQDSSKRLKDWLDPSGLRPAFLDGVYGGAVAPMLDATLYYFGGAGGTKCTDTIRPILLLGNSGKTTLTSAVIRYGVGTSLTKRFVWTGSMKQYEVDTLILPIIMNNVGERVFNARLDSINLAADNNTTNNLVSSNFNALADRINIRLILNTDCYPEETSWFIFQTDSTKNLYSKQNYMVNQNGYKDTVNMCLSAKTCYTFRIKDFYGDGMSGGSGCTRLGSFLLEDDYKNVLADLSQANADFGYRLDKPFCMRSLETLQLAQKTTFEVVPNPATEQVVIHTHFAGEKSLVVVDIMGKVLIEKTSTDQDISLDVSRFPSGNYIIQLKSDYEIATGKLQIVSGN